MSDEQIPVGSKWRSGDGDVVTVAAIMSYGIEYEVHGSMYLTAMSRDAFLGYFKRIEEPKPALEEIPVGSKWRSADYPNCVLTVTAAADDDMFIVDCSCGMTGMGYAREDIEKEWVRDTAAAPATALKPGDVVKDPAMLMAGMRVRSRITGMAYKLTERLGGLAAGYWRATEEATTAVYYISETAVEDGRYTYLGGPDEAEGTRKPRVGKYPAWKLEITAGGPEPKPSDPWEEHLRQEREIAAKMERGWYPAVLDTSEPLQVGTWSPSVTGLGGMIGGVIRRR